MAVGGDAPLLEGAPAPETPQRVEAFLRQVRLFRMLPQAELRSLARELLVEDYKSSETIIKQGESGDSMYIVWTGGCSARFGPEPASSMHYRSGDWFGEFALLHPKRYGVRRATVACDEPSRVLRLARPSFDALRSSSRGSIRMIATLLYDKPGPYRVSWAMTQLFLRIAYAIIFWPVITVWFFYGAGFAAAASGVLGGGPLQEVLAYLILSAVILRGLSELSAIIPTGPESIAHLLHARGVQPWKVSLVEKLGAPLAGIGRFSLWALLAGVLLRALAAALRLRGLQGVSRYGVGVGDLVDGALAGVQYLWVALACTGIAGYVLSVKDPPERILNDDGVGSPDGTWAHTIETYYMALQDPRSFSDDFVVDLAGAVSRVIVAATVLVFTVPWLWLFGFSPAQVVAFGGLGTVAFGFASKEVLENLFSGALLTISKPFVRGDRLRTDDAKVKGVVRKVGIAYSQINTDDGETVMMPNSMMLRKAPVNLTRRRFRVVSHTFSVVLKDYSILREVCARLKEVLAEHPDVIRGNKLQELKAQDPQLRIFEPQCTFGGFGDRGAEIAVLAYTENIRDPRFMQIHSEVLLRVTEELLKFGATFALGANLCAAQAT